MDKIITIKSNEQVNMPEITRIINGMVYSGSRIKVITDKYYIQFNFSRDGNISCSSNIINSQFTRERNYYENSGWTPALCSNFIYQWMTICRKSLY